MKVLWFHLMPYPDLPDDFREQYRSVWVDIPPHLADPKVVAAVYNSYLDQLEHAEACGFDGLCVNEHHQNAYGLMPSPNLICREPIRGLVRRRRHDLGGDGRAGLRDRRRAGHGPGQARGGGPQPQGRPPHVPAAVRQHGRRDCAHEHRAVPTAPLAGRPRRITSGGSPPRSTRWTPRAPSPVRSWRPRPAACLQPRWPCSDPKRSHASRSSRRSGSWATPAARTLSAPRPTSVSGCCSPGTTLETKLAANVTAQFVLTKAVVPAMIERGGGTVVNITSAVATSDPPAPAGRGGWGLAYAMSKGAFHRVAGILAVELADRGIRAFNVEPGFVVTERMEANARALRFEGRYQGCPPSVVGAVIAWLAVNARGEAAALNGSTVQAQRFALERGLHPDWRSDD